MNNLSIFLFTVSSFILFASPVTSLAKIKNSKAYFYKGEWILTGNNKKLFDTPIGALYRLQENVLINGDEITNSQKIKIVTPIKKEKPPLKYDSLERHKYSCAYRYIGDRDEKIINAIGINFCKKIKDQKKLRRFVVIDFKMRQYPALSKNKTSFLKLKFFNSNHNASFVRTYNHTKQVLFLGLQGVHLLNKYGLVNGSGNIINYNQNLKPYKLNHVRFIFDRDNPTALCHTVNINGNISFFENISVKDNKSFGLFMEKISPDKAKYRKLIELSDPFIYSTNDITELSKLTQIPINSEYPYNRYLEDEFLEQNKKRYFNKVKRFKNPDQIYAYAMHFMKGTDLISAAKLFKHLARHENHVLAMRQLGLCYFLGIGYPQNLETAKHWFEKAVHYGDLESIPYNEFLKFKLLSKPNIDWTTRKKIYNYRSASRHRQFFDFQNSNSHILNHGPIRHWDLILRLRNALFKKYLPPSSFLASEYEKIKYWQNIALNELTYKRRTALFLDNLLEKQRGFTTQINLPAYYYFKGQFLVKQWAKEVKDIRNSTFEDKNKYKAKLKKCDKYLRDAIIQFKKGIKSHKKIDCELEILQCQLRLNELDVDIFSDEFYYKYAEHPLYHILKYAIKYPKNIALKEFLYCDYKKAFERFKKISSANLSLIKGAIALYLYHVHDEMFYYNNLATISEHLKASRDMTIRDTYLEDFINSLTAGFRHLNDADRRKIKEAKFLKAIELHKRRYNTRAKEFNSYEAQALFNELAHIKYIKALFYVYQAKFSQSQGFIGTKNWLKDLKPMLKAKQPEAWLLAGDIYKKMHGLNLKTRNKILKIYLQAHKYGSIEALDRIARIFYSSGLENIMARGTQYWKKYIDEINLRREKNEFDFYTKKPHFLKSYSVWEEEQISASGAKSIKIRTNIKKFKISMFYYNFMNNIVFFDVTGKIISPGNEKAQKMLKELFQSRTPPEYVLKEDRIIKIQD